MTNFQTINGAKGQATLQVLVFMIVTVIITAGFVTWVQAILQSSLREYNKTLAFAIAEAGIEYYRWHLAHDADDYQDGTGQPGPYVHNYYDKDGNLLGTFTLDITPPPTGSTIVTIKSTGNVATDSTIEKIIQVQLGIPSFARYAIIANANIRFGEGTEVFGSVHSNGGIRFDGLAHNTVNSAKSEFNDPDHSGLNEFGVHTHVSPTDPLPPEPVPSRPDVFEAGRSFPVPAVDFDGLSQHIAEMKSDAQAGGFYQAYSDDEGYEIILKTDDTFDLYEVTSVEDRSPACSNAMGQNGWGLWTIENKTFVGNYSFPANGVIFIEDNVWVSGQIDGVRISIASGRFPELPSTRTGITINSDLLYTNYDGQDVVGLIAQQDINVGWDSEDDLRIDAAMVAKSGRVGRYYYRPPFQQSERCSPHHIKTKITTYGMIATNQRYGFAYTDGTGYQTRDLYYDNNLLYGPPPSFPFTSDQYEQISWEETK